MKIKNLYTSVFMLMLSATPFLSSCSDEYEYTTDYSAYNNVSLKIDMVDENNVLNLNLINETYSVKVNVAPENVIINPNGYIYEIADENIAKIDKSGLLTMLKDGETKLTVKFRGNQEVATSCIVKIKPIMTEKLSLPEEIIVEEEKTFNLFEMISILPAEASRKLSYSAKDKEIATVDQDGMVKGIKEGETTITVTTTDGTNLSGEVKVKVLGKIYIDEIQFQDAKVNGKNFVKGQILNLAKFVTIHPSNASEPFLKYTVTEGENVVSVSKEGIATCLGAGEATVKIEATDNNPNGIVGKVIKIKVVDNGWYERSFWTVDTSYKFDSPGDDLGVINYIPDNGKGMPEQLIDGNKGTYITYLKPNRGSFNGYEQHNTEHYIIIDMGGEAEFNCFKWIHRNTRNKNWQVWKVSILGSNNGETYNPIKEDIVLDKNTLEKDYDIPNSKYRYIKLELKDWDKKSGYNMTIAEFNVCKQ